MDKQMTLFSEFRAAGAVETHGEGMLCRREAVRMAPVAHRDDPITSTLAADRHERSGAREGNLRAVQQGVWKWPGRTSRELAKLLGMDRHEVARRLPDLEKAGLVCKGPARVCREGGTMAVTWERVN